MVSKLKLWHIIVGIIALYIIATYGGGFIGAAGTPYTGTCKVGQKSVATIKCDFDQEDFYEWTDFDEVTFVNYFYEAEVTIWDEGFVENGRIIESSTGIVVCDATPLWISGKPHCSDFDNFEYGKSYKIETGGIAGNFVYVRITGYPLVLYYSDAFGYDEVKIKGTQGCIAENMAYNLQQSGLSEPLEGLLEPVQNMNLGDAFTYTIAYEEIAPVGLQWYNGIPVSCEQNNFLLRSYTEVDAEYGTTCWLLPDEVILRDSTLCCDSVWCRQTLNEDYVCENFQCIFEGEETRGCNVDSECGDTYCSLSATGTYSYYHPYCDKTKSQPQNNKLGTCDTLEEKGLECCPEERYPNDMCCHLNIYGEWELMPCEHGLFSCTQILGPDACCLDTQSSFTIHECSSGLICCDAEIDGLGYCAEECRPKAFSISDWLGIPSLKNWLEGLGLDIDENLLLLVIVIIAGLIVIMLIPGRGSYRVIGPPGYIGSRRIIQ